MTNDKNWATELIGLNAGEKIKPLAANVNNDGYNGVFRFEEEPQWNDSTWTLSQLRFLVGPICEEFGLDPALIVPAGSNYSPSAALKNAKFFRAQKMAEQVRGEMNM
jgi:hypothetical protein